jgi:hypothetical protein
MVKMFCVSLLGIFLNFTCLLFCCAILVLSCTQEHFRLAEGGSLEASNIVFDKAAQKSDKGCRQTRPTCLYCFILLTDIVPFIIIFVILNDNFLSCNNICGTTCRC